MTRKYVCVIKNRTDDSEGKEFTKTNLVGICLTREATMEMIGGYLSGVPDEAIIRPFNRKDKTKFRKNGEVTQGFVVVYGRLVDYYWCEKVEAFE